MERFWLVLKVISLALIAILVVQNIDMVHVQVLGWTITMPMALLVVVIYLLGMLSGRGLMGVIRRLRHQEHRN
ncbi:LapA family protein [Halomonas cupida]|uniref:Lipopolysaccharide assembly protein A domain-containing protein n=1 Tax=Halomonas cupida TaxID=44933 RepID=A0A1M7AKZ4_9GAMM|nr:LapA family protein [Halomonas cupida]GEN22349.1 hypothetical protein HCU01_02980 [Halomonas cupida]SHL43176.1 Protein of unknown function [Halomonas cupida]